MDEVATGAAILFAIFIVAVALSVLVMLADLLIRRARRR